MLVYLGLGERRYGVQTLPPTRRSRWEFEAVLRGRCAPIVPGKPEQPMRRRTLWVFPPGHLHGWTGAGAEPCEVVVFQFDHVPPMLRDYVAEHGPMRAPLRPADVTLLRRLTRDIARDYHRPTALSNLRFDTTALSLAVLALRELDDQPLASPTGLARQKAASALIWYAEHMPSGPGVADVARAMSVSISHLRRLFNVACGESPLAAMRRLQIDRAKDLLRRHDLPLKSVTAACGFSAPSVFWRAFRDSEGVGPREWKRISA